MICKYCQGEMSDDAKFCPTCGERVVEELAEETVEIVPDETPVLDESEETVSPEEVAAGGKNLKKMKRIAAISGCIAGLAVLGTILVVGIMGNWEIFDFLRHRENDVFYKSSYSVSDSKAENKADVVVGTMGELQLTNAQLQMHYWMQVYDFIDQYGYYASMMGMDYTAPLDEQEFKEGQTWQQYFLDTAVQNWQTYAALFLEAKANGYTLEADYQEALNYLEKNMQESATKSGFASIDEMIADEMGAGTTFADYYAYLEQYYTGYAYFNYCYDQANPSEDEIEAYFAANKDKFASNSINKQSGIYVDVRHILQKIDKFGEKAKDADKDDPNYGYSQEAWDACLVAAQAILDEWLAGEKTEESFGELANEHSDDQNGNVTNGGLYAGVEKGQMVETFNDWIFDEVRVVGDYGLVKTQYGYHIMYFSGSEEIWHAQAKAALIEEQIGKMVENAVLSHPIEIDYKKIVLAVVEMGK